MPEKQVEAQCYLCQNQCRVRFLVSIHEDVVTAKKLQAEYQRMSEKSCKRLKQVEGQPLHMALSILRRPRKPTIVVGGH